MTSRIVRTLALVALLGGVTAAAIAEADNAELRTRIDAIVEPYLATRDFMGVIAVQRDGESAVVAPYGLASLELGVPHTAASVFRIGSISKQFTAAAILRLEEKGLLSTEDPVREHLPDFGHGEVTVDQLLSHTAGILDIYSLDRFGESAGQVGTLDEILTDLGTAELTHPPGSAYAYSNGGYVVVAAIVEEVTGEPFGEALEQLLFGPLEMDDTAHDAPGPAVHGRVAGYDPWGPDELRPTIPLSPVYSGGPGSLWSSASDLLAWSSALHGGRVLSDGSYRKLVRDAGSGYGYGVSVFRRFDRDVIGHDGRINGFASDLARYVDDRLTVVVLSNVQSVARDEIRRSVAAEALGEMLAIPPRRTFVERPREALTELVGEYSFGPGFVVTIREEGGRLLARANQGGSSELVSVSEAEWFSRMLYATVRFGRNEAGNVDRLIWGAGDGAPVGRRVR